MLSILEENGYLLNRLNHDTKTIEGGEKIRILTESRVPFLIIYSFSADAEDISFAFERNKEENDDCCSLFVINSSSGIDIFSKNMKSGLFSKLRDMIIYHAINNNREKAQRVIESNYFESVFFEAHSFLRDIDGLHPDEALDELCKLIYAKLYDEEMGLDIFVKPAGNAEEFAANIRYLYKEANEYDVRVYALKIPGYKRSRGVFAESITLSSNALYKAGQLFSKYNFSKADIDYKARAFQNVYKPAARAGMGQYFTPLQVIRLIVKCISPSDKDLIIDPFAGSGHFLSESLYYVENKLQNKKAINEFIFYKLHGIEKSERMVRIAMTDMRLHGDGHSNIRCADSLLSFDSYSDLTPDTFDIVMTNPPFGSILQKESYSYLGDFSIIDGRGKVPLEILGLERGIQLLRLGGRIGIVLPESIFANKSYQFVRDWLKENVTIRGIISLPQHTFAPFGANIKTSVLIATKGKRKRQYNVFTGIVENIGYDSKGDEMEGEDWLEVAEQFSAFINEEGW